MTKINWLGIIISILLVSNGMLAYKIMSSTNKLGHRQHKKQKTPKEVIIYALGFDDTQQKQYELTITNHRQNIRKKDKKILKKKGQLFSLLVAPNDSLKTRYLADLGKLKSEVDSIHFAHFLEIKEICKTVQLDAFNTLTIDLGRLFLAPGPNKPRD
jgi:protein CpxP